MLRGGDQYAFLHQGGSVTYPGDIPGLGFDCKSLEIGAPEQDPSFGRSWAKAQVYSDASMESEAGDGNGRSNGLLVGQIVPRREICSTYLAICEL